MSFPDQSYIERVRTSLWKRSGGGASVMVGSGFSRNAQNINPAAPDPPTWPDLTDRMFTKLYPQGHRRIPHERTVATAFHHNVLSIAQEFKAAFGRSELYRFLYRQVQDDNLRPGDAHIRLLRLPWRDIFSTNWDTLLERSRVPVTERAYTIVRTMEELPLAQRPRIIKLHGSFPANFPLIITEEEYRKYPINFAPFVNTVQQSMMESVFCLLGFSGSDPNFIQWSGWVRDNLGTSAPKIYLVGWLDLSPHRRRMLEDRYVVPIDLARHPKAHQWPEHRRHDYATEWILHTFEHGRPYDVTEWPTKRANRFPPIPGHLRPVYKSVYTVPIEESTELSELDSDNASARVRNMLDVWEHNRMIYPGWLVVPSTVRRGLSYSTNTWEPRILDAFPDLPRLVQLSAIYELVWRREILLDPISTKLEAAAVTVLSQIDCHARTIDGSPDSEIEWSTVRQKWRTIALGLVRVARHRFDQDLFEQRIALLSPFLDDEMDLPNRIHHERCLWAISSMDFVALEGLLADWNTEDCDSVWMIRKSALLAEVGQKDGAAQLVEQALAAIRELPINDRSVAGPSREAWALVSVFEFENLRTLMRRWDELSPLKCNAWLELDNFKKAIKDQGDTEDAPLFDLDMRRGDTIRLSNIDPHAAAYRALYLSEVAAVPGPQ